MAFVAGTVGKFAFLAVFIAVFWFFVNRTAQGSRLTIRRIAGFDALDEAIGRCTEMGRPVHYTFGIGELDANVLASFDVLSYVAGQCARMNTDLIVTNALGRDNRGLRGRTVEIDHRIADRTFQHLAASGLGRRIGLVVPARRE